MPQFNYFPALPKKFWAGNFIQTIELLQDGKSIGSIRWSLTDSEQGAIQIVDLRVDPLHQRKGHGRRLLNELVRQAKVFQKEQERPTRRLWAVLEQKAHVVPRAFLTHCGFHHVSTIPDLFKREDALVYTRSFD